MSFVLKGDDAEDKKQREMRLMQYLIDHSGEGMIRYQLSFGEEEYLMFGETTHGFPPSFEPGLVRFAVGRAPESHNVAPFLEQALEHAARKP